MDYFSCVFALFQQKKNPHLYLPVSLGEAIDKLTILDIKLQKIKDKRRKDVLTEHHLLHLELREFVKKYSDLYEMMKRVNLLIWDMMDALRDGTLDEMEYLQICKKCIEYNDIRFRIKNKINYVSNSRLKEQKGYSVTRAIIEINNEIKNVDDFIRPIKYYSVFYDELVIVSNNFFLGKQLEFDPTIRFVTQLKDNIECKQQWTFADKEYSLEQVYAGFELSEDMITLLL